MDEAVQSLFAALITFVLLTPVYASGCPDRATSTGHAIGASNLPPESALIVSFDREQQRLRVVARGQNLNKVLTAIASQTGIDFTVYDDACQPVTTDMDYLPLKTALAQILKNRNYVVGQAGPDRRLRVWVLPTGKAEALTEQDVLLDEFYKSLRGTTQAEELAEELRGLQSRQP